MMKVPKVQYRYVRTVFIILVVFKQTITFAFYLHDGNGLNVQMQTDVQKYVTDWLLKAVSGLQNNALESRLTGHWNITR